METTRASRDGHEFHEQWAARKALQLLMPLDGFVGIAVEGPSPDDQMAASKQTVEVADLVMYYGKRSTFEAASSVVIIQIKYSKRFATVPFRASDAKKTLQKFASAFISYKKKYGPRNVERKLAFELVTNRPIYTGFAEAIKGLAASRLLKGDAKKQANQFKSACGLKGKELADFAQKVAVTGLTGNLQQNKQRLARTLADWSVAPDALARARLGNLRKLLRDKAGLAGEGENVIHRVDVLDALELQGPEDLFPCPASFPKVGKVVKREQLDALAERISTPGKTLLVHADGGVGKTVFLQSLAKLLGDAHETVLFDCFGGGAYRSSNDARHLPKRGLIHIINSLACKGLCDPLLPINEHVEDLTRAFRVRLAQAVGTLQRGAPGKQLLLFIDAIDNAAEHARDRGEDAFPKLLLESFHYSGPVPGVRLVVSCRTYRREISRGDIPCEEVKLEAFSQKEAKKYLRARISNVTDAQIHVAYSRSQGNPRVLEHLALSDRGLLDPSEVNKVIELDDLLKGRIEKALEEASRQGYTQAAINAFLAGLSVLPPPVPLEEYADAHGMELSAVKSFAADLAPLLEQTKHGLMFRDEPTEDLVSRMYAANVETLGALANNLLKKQGSSVYAATALPALLQKLDDGARLFDLAFDERVPTTITSIVGQQNIRYARIKAAVLHAARNKDFDRLVRLLVELSTLAAQDERGTEYIANNPDLVVVSDDFDATRRLFEMRSSWPGTRHARLAIANVLSGDLGNGYRHAKSASEWISHYYQRDEEYRRERGGPERVDIASLPLCLIADDRERDAAQYMKDWPDWYAYEVAEDVFTLLQQAEKMGTVPTAKIRRFLGFLKSQLGALTAAVSFMELDAATRRPLIVELAKTCKAKKKPLKVNRDLHRERDYVVQDGLLKAAAIAMATRMKSEALAILGAVPVERPRIYSFMDRFSNPGAFPFVTFLAVSAAVERRHVGPHELLPLELTELGGRVPESPLDSFSKALKAEVEKQFEAGKKLPEDKSGMSYEAKQEADRFINERLGPLHEMSNAFATVLSASSGNCDGPFERMMDTWSKLRKRRGLYSSGDERDQLLDMLGREAIIFSLWSRSDLQSASISKFVAKMGEAEFTPASTLIEIVGVLSQRPTLHELAGKTAIKARAIIEREDEVGHRASLFARLSRAIAPASFTEAASYFRAGLDQMDAIGSGDYQFTNELLQFAAEAKGPELEESDFHTLSNICELNMSSEEEKFPWLSFARGLARTSGCRTLAKLGRWEDRDKITLNYTLLPYLAALIEQDKIDPSIAIALLRVSNSVELHVCGTEELADVIAKKQYPNAKQLLTELISQFEANHPGVFMPSALRKLHQIAERLDPNSEQSVYLSHAAPKFEKLRDEENENRNFQGSRDLRIGQRDNSEEDASRVAVDKLEQETDPVDEASMSRAVDTLNGLSHVFGLKREFYEKLRAKVKYENRPQYVQILARLDGLDIYTKLHELKECKDKWSASSVAVETVFHDVGIPLIQRHPDEFVDHGYLSESRLKEVAELSGTSMPLLALELIVIFAAPDGHLSASIWIGLAAITCGKAKEGEAQAALKRLLNSGSAKLASTVVDGAWRDGLYPEGGETDIAAGLVWLSLGSPEAAKRWRAAHSLRCFARLGKWEVVDAVVARFESIDAHPYQAPELPFYFLHARLWLLIALARIAMDHAQNVAKYAEPLKRVALDKSFPHVLFRHFAAQTLLTCIEKGSLAFAGADVKALKKVNDSLLPKKTEKGYGREAFYQKRPDSVPEPTPEFYVDYDFNKTDVSRLSNVFGKAGWEATDALTAWVRKYDATITNMHANGGRSSRERDRGMGISARYHVYGQQLGWHALHLVAGDLLGKYPIVQRQHDTDDPWHDWLKGELLTRIDGLWLADGVDRPPVDAQVNLLEKGIERLAITGDRATLLSLLNISSSVPDELVVAGDWKSVDGVGIHINSALVSQRKAKKLALELSQEDPFQTWLPRLEAYDYGEEYSSSEREPYVPWIVWPSKEGRLDDTDSLGIASVVKRLYFSKAVNISESIKPTDAFRRKWVDPQGRIIARSEAWGSNSRYDDEESGTAERLVCSSAFLKEVLEKRNEELVMLVILRRYEKGYGRESGKFWHTTAVVRIDKSMKFQFHPGVVNKLHQSRF